MLGLRKDGKKRIRAFLLKKNAPRVAKAISVELKSDSSLNQEDDVEKQVNSCKSDLKELEEKSIIVKC